VRNPLEVRTTATLSLPQRTVGPMGYVYAFRHGQEDEFKFGLTNNLEQRRRSLQTGCPKPLTLFGYIETENAKEGEKFILGQLAHKRLTGEFRAVTAEEAHEAIVACQDYLEHELPRRREEDRKIAELTAIESDQEMLASSEEVLEKHKRLLQLRVEKRCKQIEIDRIEAEESRLETALKLAIGASKGIEGIATWETGDSSRVFNADAVKAADPELYEMYLTRFDQARFRLEHPKEYISCQQTTRVRKFKLIEDL
jgi:Meiotically up-regulated gene 113